jgi:hypothetical protein
MKEQKNHLDIDLEFLDKKESTQHTAKRENDGGQTLGTPKKHQTGTQYNWKNILIIGGIVLFFIWIVSSESESTPSTNNSYIPSTSTNSPNTNGDNIVIGEYSCSRYHYDKATALSPDDTEQQIDDASSAFEYRTNSLENLSDKIDNADIDDYSSQYEVDEYNDDVSRYNSLLSNYKNDSDLLDRRIERYNAQVDIYNNYLSSNCTKQY